MKYTISTIIALFLTITVQAQVAIEKESITNSSVILEFDDVRTTPSKQKSLILPVLDNLSGIPSNQAGTLALNAADNTVMLQRNNGVWEIISTSTVDFESPTAAELNGGSIIGDQANAPDGVLVLNSTTQAMILPHVTKVEDVAEPEVGAWVYDVQRKALAFYNGENWELRYGN